MDITVPTCCAVVQTPRAEARSVTGKRSATSSTSSGLTTAAVRPAAPHSTIIADEDALVLTSDPFGELREFWQGLRRAGKMGDEAAAAASSGGAGQSKL